MSDRSEFLAAEEHYNAEEYEEAFKIYTSLAERGSVDSKVFLGWMYQNGLGVEKDFEKAFSCYQEAAKLGSPEGQFYLAKSYARKKDYERAMEWYRRAADKDYPPALFRLGWIYDIGRGAEIDKDKAFGFYKRAAERGHVFAQKGLALLLIRNYRGFFWRIPGVFLLLKSVVSGIWNAARDPHSEHLRD